MKRFFESKQKKTEQKPKASTTIVNESKAFLLGALGLSLPELNLTKEADESKKAEESVEESELDSRRSSSTIYENVGAELTDYEEDTPDPIQTTGPRS